MELPASLKDKTTGWQKFVAFGLMAGTGYLGFVVLAAMLPTILLAAQSLFWLVVIAVCFGLPALYMVTNPLVVWGFFKSLAWNFTKFLIKMDPLSVMDRYVEYLQKKLKNMKGSVDTLRGKEEKLERELSALSDSYAKNLENGQAALKQGKSSAASTYGLYAKTDKDKLARMQPLLQRTKTSLKLMSDLEEAAGETILRLSYQIQSRRSEYELNKEVFKGLKSAEDFINSDSDAAKLYGQSIIELEEQTTQYIGYIDGFERRSKGLVENIAIEKQANIDAGLLELQQYMNAGQPMAIDLSRNIQLPGMSEIKVEAGKKFNF